MSENGFSAQTFWPHLTSELVACCFQRERGNFDHERFGRASSTRGPIKNTILDLAANAGFYRFPGTFARLPAIPGLDTAYALLEDQPSRDLFVRILVYRMLGYEQVRLARNNTNYWTLRRSLPEYIEGGPGKNSTTGTGTLDLYAINGIRLLTDQWGALNTFLLEQYRCVRAGIGVEPDDVVIDGGGCFGDTALYFAQKARQVYCFECMPANLAIARKNLAMNPALAGKIYLVERALWSRPGERLVFDDRGPASHRASNEKGTVVSTQTIDELVREAGLERVDFIKMDIEGAEPEALMGAKDTLRTFRPRLAITLYHDTRHFAQIPNWLAGLGLGYRFYIDHFTIHSEETVLFARSRQ